MAMTPGPGRGGMKAEINVTPLVDVVLVLLIIFMVVTPMMQKGRAVQLPKASHPNPGAKADPLVLSITEDQKLFIENERVANLAQLKSRLEQELRSQPARRIRLKADQALACGDVQQVMEAIYASGAKNVGLGVEELRNP